MAQSVVDHLSNADIHIARAVKELKGSEARRSVFCAIYQGRRQQKSVQDLCLATGLSPKQVLTHGKKLADKELVSQHNLASGVHYGKIKHFDVHKGKIINYASDKKKSRKLLMIAQGSAQTTIGVVNMGDKYITGQAGAVGRNARAENASFQQVWTGGSELDLQKLSDDLGFLRSEIRKLNDSLEHDIVNGQLASAEIAAKNGDGPHAIAALKNVGKWTLDFATKVGASLAAEAIKQASM